MPRLKEHYSKAEFAEMLEAVPGPIRRRFAWKNILARPDQLPPDGDWTTWFLMSGRGAGKTRTAAEYVLDLAQRTPNLRIAIIVPAFAVGRDVCIEGESGLLAIAPPSIISKWNRSMGELVLTNGSQFQIFSSEEPDRLRGPQHHYAWCEELCSWRHVEETWDMMMMGLRLGDRPRVMVTSTPKPLKFVKDLTNRASTKVVRVSTFENRANLPASYIQELIDKYEGTRRGRQELHGELIDEVEGALWSAQSLQDTRLDPDDVPDDAYIVVAVDPSVSHDGDESGIIVVAGWHDDDNKLHVGAVADFTVPTGDPLVWAKASVAAYHKFEADIIIAEKNQGGLMVETTIRQFDQDKAIPIKLVNASKGKRTRAQPTSMLHEQGRGHMIGRHPDLEEQLTTWVEGDPNSPDRLDAYVWGTSWLIKHRAKRGSARSHRHAQTRRPMRS